jgi:transposase
VGTPAHAFYDRLNEILDRRHFDRNVEHLCRRYYKGPLGRPSITPGVYFRSLLLGYFEGIDSERGIAWRLADSLSMRRFVDYALTEATPDHSSISRTRRLFAVETHTAVFRWVLKILAEEGLVEEKTVSIDATTLEANAALRSLVRRDNGQKYDDYLKDLAKAAGIENPTREQLARLDRKRKKKGSNKEWKNPYDPQDALLDLTIYPLVIHDEQISPGTVGLCANEQIGAPMSLSLTHGAAINKYYYRISATRRDTRSSRWQASPLMESASYGDRTSPTVEDLSGRDPALLIGRESSPRNDAMHVGVMQEVLAPGV